MNQTEQQVPLNIFEERKCLDQGSVRLVSVMGDDRAIVQAARVSYGSGGKTDAEDKALIRYLLRHKHTTPFEMVEFKFHCKMPIFVARQWIRHRTANVNEMSGRYSELPEEFYTPEAYSPQSASNKQGREEGGDLGQKPITMYGDPSVTLVPFTLPLSKVIKQHSEQAFDVYRKALELGVSKEMARMHLPLSVYTQWYWKIDLHNLFHFLRLRLDSHAQYEIRVFAEAMADIVKQIVPWAWEAFEDYVLNARTFSAKEMEFINECVQAWADEQTGMNTAKEQVTRRLEERLSPREIGELLQKLSFSGE